MKRKIHFVEKGCASFHWEIFFTERCKMLVSAKGFYKRCIALCTGSLADYFLLKICFRKGQWGVEWWWKEALHVFLIHFFSKLAFL